MKVDQFGKLLGAEAKTTLSESFAKAIYQMPPDIYNQIGVAARAPSPLNFPVLTAPKRLVDPMLTITEEPGGRVTVNVPPEFIAKHGIDFGAAIRGQFEAYLVKMILAKVEVVSETDDVTGGIIVKAKVVL